MIEIIFSNYSNDKTINIVEWDDTTPIPCIGDDVGMFLLEDRIESGSKSIIGIVKKRKFMYADPGAVKTVGMRRIYLSIRLD